MPKSRSMQKGKGMGKRVLRSIEDFEKRFFPQAFQASKLKEQSAEPASHGTGFANALLREIRQELSRR